MNFTSLIVLELVGLVLIIGLSKNASILNDSTISDDNKQANKSNKKIIKCRIIFFLLLLLEIVISLIFKGYPSINSLYFFIWLVSFIIVLNNNTKPSNIITSMDNRFLIENGIGYKVNLNTRKGKIFVYSLLIFVILLLIFLTISDFYIPNIQINKNNASVQDLDYSYNFKISDIKNVTMSKDIHIINKIYGTETLKYARGKFNIDKYGKSQVYIFKDSHDYIIIKLNGINIIYNESNKNKTLQEYKKLLSIE